MALDFLAFRLTQAWVTSAEFERIELRGRSRAPVRAGYVSRQEAAYLLAHDLTVAESRAWQALALNRNDVVARYLLGAVLLRKGDWREARRVLQRVAETQPHFSAAWSELGVVLQKLDENSKAVGAFFQALSFDPLDEDAWYALGNLLRFSDGTESVINSTDISPLHNAETALCEEQLETAETILRSVIEAQPYNAKALKLLADVLICGGQWPEARTLLDRCLKSAPLCVKARFRYASMLTTHKEFGSAAPHIEELLNSEPNNLLYRLLRAIALEGNKKYELAILEYERILEEAPDRPGLWLQYAQIVKTHRPKNSVPIFEKVFQHAPFLVDAIYALATVKSFHFDAPWIERIRPQCDRPSIDIESLAKLHFVLGKAYEDIGEYASSYEHYRTSNDIQRNFRQPDTKQDEQFARRAISVFTKRFVEARTGVGCEQSGAIFIVGLPRSGSTLIEQMLTSHSAIEGLGELPDLPSIIRQLGPSPYEYPVYLKALHPSRFQELGREYLELTRKRRTSNKPLFTDKLPINYAHTILIHLMLPNAKIIDIRRHPLDCGFSCYKHFFAAGQERTLAFRSMGRWYAEYVELMAHFDDLLPGRVHRIIYEKLVEDPAGELRRMLEYLGQPFEEECLRFHETERIVDTISAEQVRMPLYDSAIGHWRHYEQWLGALKEELGPVLECYPEPPQFFPRLRGRIASRPVNTPGAFRLVRGTQQRVFENAP